MVFLTVLVWVFSEAGGNLLNLAWTLPLQKQKENHQQVLFFN